MERTNTRVILNYLLALSPSEFENVVARLLPHLGYRDVRRTGGAGDLGVDIVCTNAHGGLVAVQCKRYAHGNNVTSPDIQHFFGMLVHHGARHGVYITTSTFTKSAFDLATARDIQTIDGEELATLFVSHRDALEIGPLIRAPSGTAQTSLRDMRWQLTELPTPSEFTSNAKAINNRGQVVGDATGDLITAVLWENGRMVFLDTTEGWESYARDVNDAGQVVGYECGFFDEEHQTRAVLWDNGRRIELEGLNEARAINNRGQIVGSSYSYIDSREPWRLRWETKGVLWEDGRVTVLDDFQASSINNYGVIAGSFSRGVPIVRSDDGAAMWTAGRINLLTVPSRHKGYADLLAANPNLIEEVTSYAVDINDRGQIIGYVTHYYHDFDPDRTPKLQYGAGPHTRYVLWQRGVIDLLRDLPERYAGVHKINNLGQICLRQLTNTDQRRACLWEDGGTVLLPLPTEADDEDEVETEAIDMNDLGQVIRWYAVADDVPRACLWECQIL